MLVFDVELISIDRQPAPPAAPDDVAAAPADANRYQVTIPLSWFPGVSAERSEARGLVAIHLGSIS